MIESRRQRGVSLIEALVALAVMAFGMLAVVGVQATLRLNADVAKQRSEAVRIAQEAIEDWRSFVILDADPADGKTGYQELVGDSADVPVPGVNTTFRLMRAVSDETDPRRKRLTVDVSWTDRAGQPQSVQFNTVVAGIAPNLAASISLPAFGSPIQAPLGRHGSIPIEAKLFPDGTSGFRPPQPVGGTVAWLFDNATGLITVCQSTVNDTALLTRADITACATTGAAQLLSGRVRFAYNATPTAAVAENPTGTALNLDISVALTSTGHPTPDYVCFDDAPVSATPTITATSVRYYCLIYSNVARRWSGRSTVVPLGLDAAPAWTIAAAGIGNYKVCRYTPSGVANPTNAQHPRDYSDVDLAQVMTNQNFLIIRADDSCPTDTPPVPANGDFVDSNTVQHQPPP